MKFFSFEKKYKLLLDNNFIYKDLNIKKSMFFNIYYIYNNLKYPRICICINKKKLKLANKRNLIKRIIRECFRLNKNKILNLDYIFKLNININYKFNIFNIKDDLKYILNNFIKN